MVDASSGNKTSGQAFDELVELRHQQLRLEAGLQRCEELGLERFALTTDLASWHFRRIRALGRQAYNRFLAASAEESQDLPIYGPEFDRAGPRVLELLVETWANASLAIHGMCQARSISYLHVLQPTLHDKGSKPLTQEEIDTSDCNLAWRQGAELGYPMLRKAGAQLEGAGVAFLDASLTFGEVQETLYFDACHFVRKGHELLARAIAREYLRRLPAEGPSVPARGFRTKFFREQD